MDRNFNELMDSVKSRRAARQANRRMYGATAGCAALIFIIWTSVYPSAPFFKKNIFEEYDNSLALSSSNKTSIAIQRLFTPELIVTPKHENYNNLVTVIKSKDEKSMVTRVSRNEILDIINKQGGGEVTMNGKTMFVFSSR